MVNMIVNLADLGLSIPYTVWFGDFHSGFRHDYIKNMFGVNT